MKRTIEITVSPIGDISIEAVGFKGPDCEQATKFLETVLGTVNTRSRKPEFHQQTTSTRQQKIGG
jgi:hypothetical protein